MRSVAVFLLAMGLAGSSQASPPQQAPTPPQQQQPPAPAPPVIEQVGPPPRLEPAPPPTDAASSEAAQLRDLLHKVWLAEYRVNDLLTEVHPERWKLAPEGVDSFNRVLETLRSELNALENWRGQFEKRTDSGYLSFETYAAIAAVLPRLDGVARAVSQYENSSLAAQYNQAQSDLLDIQQALGSYVGLLLRNPDEMLQATQNNLAACENQLSFAMRATAEKAKAIANTPPIRPLSRRPRRRTPAPGAAGTGQKVEKQKGAGVGAPGGSPPTAPPVPEPKMQ